MLVDVVGPSKPLFTDRGIEDASLYQGVPGILPTVWERSMQVVSPGRFPVLFDSLVFPLA
jgi:hypothetical protein